MAYTHHALPFVLQMDGSLKGLGAILTRVQDGREKVIPYASRQLQENERHPSNYSSFRLAVVWAVTEKFPNILTGAEFLLLMDNAPPGVPADGKIRGSRADIQAGELEL